VNQPRPMPDVAAAAGALLTFAIVLLGGALVQGLADRRHAPDARPQDRRPRTPAVPRRRGAPAPFDEGGGDAARAPVRSHAITALHRVLELAPQLPEAHVNMGFALLGLQQAEPARGASSNAPPR
jgi:hypothetical protein